MGSWLKWLLYHRNYIIIVVTPLVLLPLPLCSPTSEARCGYAIILMALYWCTECMPLAVTALLPVVLFPMMGIMTAGAVSIEYLKDSNMLFMGGLLVAIAVEQWNLHKRIALRVLLLVGVRPALLMMGFMIVSSFLSMWISNTATTAMMLPISQAVLQQLKATETKANEQDFQAAAEDNRAFELEIRETKEEITNNTKQPDTQTQMENRVYEHEQSPESLKESRRQALEKKYELLTKGISLSVCYSASIGGTATLTGTTPNLILKGQIDKIFPKNDDVINFASWFGFAFPNMVLMLVFSWLWLQFMFLGFNLKQSFGCGVKTNRDKEAYTVMKEEYKKLGRMKFSEWAVLTIFVLLVVLWFTREPGFIDGWATVLFNKEDQFVSDGTIAILMSMLFFVIPSQLPKFGGYGCNEAGKMIKAPPTLLNWQLVHERMPWNIILLLGGGFALAAGSEISGLSTWLGESLAPLEKIPAYAISLLLSLLVATFTECSSNTATTTLFLPILASMAITIKIHPLYVMMPCTLAASLAFMLPVATPPNAIAFSFGKLKVIDMVKTGFMLNIIGILTINLGINTWGYAIFDMGTFPQWANITHAQP
ncbi:solute carrier family 13 member 2-like isoform X2 [Xiphias gladius]|uniref:solute carrier family 13 member 2-like isoform X2 n=1 Tax=Xiphias gladius TaxID=8245 RepID=UPI001A98ED05|nr:solute carrier family 13 member 2-like isoform X2 [Xiphias gladius]XP_040005899.1 solute carrier family 13 member 2-like isoform X2 [Xiphias gladius]XP_040005900.1 solute carrier family 13 member 2-like isoform X2 [Xiphias gladius]XP_040005901.1 solute carrier family 13 member 2-like isoform X2 [Xiphias gladius]